MTKLLLPILVLATFISAQTNNGHIFLLKGQNSQNIVLVDKSQQELSVLKFENSGILDIKNEFKITTGKVKGNKEFEGDMKTPEGIYYITSFIPDEQLLPKYGPLAMVMDYPNRVDRISKRTGSNIWIHGRDEEIRDLQTQGCISLNNKNTLELEKYMQIGLTPVIVVDTVHNISDNTASQISKVWNGKIEAWRKAWDEGDMENYIAFYSDKFIDGQGRRLHSFSEMKRSLEKRYSWKSITIDDILMLKTEQEIHVTFYQEYRCPAFTATGYKTLVFYPDKDGEWEIVKESFRKSAAKTDYADELRTFINNWKQSWESRNIASYERFYSPAFSNSNYDFIGWLAHKKETFSREQTIQVDINSLNISSVDKNIWKIVFTQHYQSDNYEDNGIKTLLVKKINQSYFIISEEWKGLE